MAITLRDYQQAAKQAVYNYFAENDGNPLVVIPTGGGKSLVIASLIQEIIQACPGERIGVITHVKELIGQNHDELLTLWPEAPAGIYSAGLKRRQLDRQVLFMGIQSVAKLAFKIQRIDLLLVDEAHLIPRTGNTRYRQFIADLKLCNPKLKIIGFTATPYRLDSGMLHEGEDAIFSDIAYEVSIKELIELGYLALPISVPGHSQIDTSGIGTRLGDFVAGALERAASDPETVESICDEIVAAAPGRKGLLAFGTGIGHCNMLLDGLRRRGIDAEGIYGDTKDRDTILAHYKARNVQCLVSMGVLTTGFNARHVDLLAVARPTKSTGLWIQMVGRGTRLSPETGKTDCLVLDFGGNIERHGPIDKPKVKPKRKGEGDGELPTKECPECGASVAIAVRECPDCGFAFPPMESKVHTKASKLSLLSDAAPPPPPEWVRVDGVMYGRHEKPGKRPMLMVTYRCGLTRFREWVTLEHDGYARTRASFWWGRRSPGPAPLSVDQALQRQGELRSPTAIQVRKNGKYWDVLAARFEEPESAAA